MKKITVGLFAVIMMVGLFFSASVFAGNSEQVGVTYRTHIQNQGWSQGWVSDGAMAGSEGQGLRLEATEIKLVNAPTNANINYFVHVQNIGDQKPDRKNGELAGTEGQGLRLEAIHIALENMPGYSVMYRVHVQNIGWQDWVSDGAIAGTAGMGLRLEGLEVKIVKVADLTAYNAALAAVQEEDVKEGWDAYKAVVDANVVTAANSQAEVDLATLRIVNAQSKLVLFANMDAYNAALAAVQEANYTTASWSAYQAVVDENVVTKDNTQAEVDTATANIVAAQANLKPASDLTAYNDAVAIYVAMGGENPDEFYRNDTWQAYADRVEQWAGFDNGVWESDITKDTPQVTVNFAAAQIAEKKDKLLVFSAYLESILPLANNNENPKVYTTPSYEAFKKATKNYRELAEITKVQSDIDFATSEIVKLQSGLVVIDRAAYDAAMAEFVALEPDAENYSYNTWTAYEEAYNAAFALEDKADVYYKTAVQADYDKATADLVAAHDKLVADADLVADVITKDSIGPVYIGDNVITKAQALVDAAYGNGFVVTINSDKERVIDDNGAVKNDGESLVTFWVTEIADSDNQSSDQHSFTIEVPAVV